MTAPLRLRLPFACHALPLVLATTLLAQDRTAPPAPATHALTGRIIARPVITTDPPLRMPTDVAALPDGTIAVADGVNDRVLLLGADGSLRETIRNVGEESLAAPIGVAADALGRLWIADTGNHRVLVRGPDGSLVATLAPAGLEGDYPLDITDVAPTSDGRAAWLVDNDNDRLIRLELAAPVQTIAGRRGESVGQLQHPFMIALDARGDIFVSDVINGRVSAFSKDGAPMPALGAYGIDVGQTYRPKGVACDADGNVWVSDSVLGVVQAFKSDGVPIDVLRGDDGAPLRFNQPMGLCFDSMGQLYVTELGADRVAKVAIQRSPTAPQQGPRRRTQIVGGQARSCTICHIEWIEPFSQNRPTGLADPPATTAQEPAVSRSEMCLSCHDGSIADSRRRVWLEHGHQTGVTPPGEMKVPDYLPLVDGKVACRTCHSAHTGGKFDPDFRTAVFLRVQNDASQLCISCHLDKTRGPEFGTHPVRGMPWAVPQPLIQAGARVGPDPRELTCQVCHTPHGSKVDHLLVMGTTNNQLCLTCHEQMRPGMFRDGDHVEHPLMPRVTPAQAAAVREMGTALSPEGQLVCLSCHKLHHGRGERFMLADDLTDGRFCIRCHAEKTAVLGSSHDLRSNFPEEKNRLGMTAHSGGPCSACHMFHRYARAPEASTLDPGGGKCITCHQTGRCAGDKSLGPINHPGSRCVDCHNPHETQHGSYLCAAPDAICARCHQQQQALAGGPHDVRRSPELWPAAAAAAQDACLACHRPHGNDESGLFRLAGSLGGADAGCRACHPAYSWGAGSAVEAVHTRALTAAMPRSELPLVPAADAHAGGIGCRTCHDPHGPSGATPALLRVEPGAAPQALCTTCHVDVAQLALTGHGAAGLGAALPDATACAPCHVVHADAAAIDTARLIPRDLAPHPTRSAQHAAPSGAPDATQLGSDVCTACHRNGGAARAPRIATHPDVALGAIAASLPSSTLPFFAAPDAAGSAARIACLTCHLPHGRPLDEEEATRLAQVSSEERRSARLMLRPFETPNACTTCHGADGLRRFLYFHDEDRRGGPLDAVRTAAR